MYDKYKKRYKKLYKKLRNKYKKISKEGKMIVLFFMSVYLIMIFNIVSYFKVVYKLSNTPIAYVEYVEYDSPAVKEVKDRLIENYYKQLYKNKIGVKYE